MNFLSLSISLKDLTFIGFVGSTTITSTCDVQVLTTLHLDNVTFINENPCDVFSKCPNWKHLTLTNFSIVGMMAFTTISHPQLLTLIIKNGDWYGVVNVVAPLLKFLTTIDCEGDGLFSLEKVDFYICYPDKEDAPKIIDMLQQFRNVKYLTLGLEIVEDSDSIFCNRHSRIHCATHGLSKVLASSVQLVSHLPSSFANLTSFKIYPANLDHFPRPLHKSQLSRMKEEEQKNLKMPTEVKNYLLDGSPNAIVTIFSHQEMKALENATKAHQIMLELQMLLAKQKYKCDNNSAPIDQSKSPMERNEANMDDQLATHFENCWQDLFWQIDEGGQKINEIFSTLR
ncbi:uncharacterized protein [Rutidosis leptorrhynchoides]|uniref:uncharacterized protein n=1 Tax=Rutidosis leptorrhynchoides TaxID=125765 RepID=UPI003A9A2B3B